MNCKICHGELDRLSTGLYDCVNSLSHKYHVDCRNQGEFALYSEEFSAVDDKINHNYVLTVNYYGAWSRLSIFVTGRKLIATHHMNAIISSDFGSEQAYIDKMKRLMLLA